MRVYLSYLILLLACGKSESPSPTVTKLNNVPVVNIFEPKIGIVLGGNAYITSSDLSYGLTGWTSPNTTVSVYFKVLDTGNYNWKPETTYKFLLQAKPTIDNYTTYTAYFFSPKLNEWQLIASFSRPKTQTYLKGLHSFLKNFSNTRGYLTRSAEYSNAWIRNENGVWNELNVAKFTGDDVAKVNFIYRTEVFLMIM